MAQTYTTDPYAGTGKTADAVMDDVNENFAALKSSFSGTSAPASPVGGQVWQDDATRKVRNYDNDAWLASLMGDADFKIPVYRNDTCDGWVIDDTVTDRVIALKGGSQDYDVDGGENAGSWILDGLSQAGHDHTVDAHRHKTYESNGVIADDEVYNSSGSQIDLENNQVHKTTGYNAWGISIETATGGDYYAPPDMYSSNASPDTDSKAPAISHDGTSRIAAAVCTLQYPDLS